MSGDLADLSTPAFAQRGCPGVEGFSPVVEIRHVAVTQEVKAAVRTIHRCHAVSSRALNGRLASPVQGAKTSTGRTFRPEDRDATRSLQHAWTPPAEQDEPQG